MSAKKRVLVCGASGFIGQNLLEHFSSLDNYEAYGTYFKNKPETYNPRIFQADLRHRDVAIWATQGIDIVINAAALTDGVGVFSQPGKSEEFRDENNKINANMTEAVCINRVKHFIFLSCTIVYPSSNMPLIEDQINIEKINPIYRIPAKMKIYGEELCQHFANLGSTKYTAVRHTNVYGLYDKFDLHRGHVLASTIVKVLQGEKEIVVWGSGDETRDFLHIDDQVEFIKKAIELQKNSFEIFNVGFGRTYSVNELVEIILSLTGKKLAVIHDLQKPTTSSGISIDVGKARRVLGWKARVDLSEGLSKTIEWYKQNYPR